MEPCLSYNSYKPFNSPGTATANPPNLDNTSFPLYISLKAKSGAISLASMEITSFSYKDVINAPPPIPDECRLTLPIHKATVTAASAALPPFLRMSTPIFEQIGTSQDTIACRPVCKWEEFGFNVGYPKGSPNGSRSILMY